MFDGLCADSLPRPVCFFPRFVLFSCYNVAISPCCGVDIHIIASDEVNGLTVLVKSHIASLRRREAAQGPVVSGHVPVAHPVRRVLLSKSSHSRLVCVSSPLLNVDMSYGTSWRS